MDPMTMMMLSKAIGSGVPALAQAGIGIAQSIKGNRMEKDLEDPIYSVPASYDKAIGMYRDRANTNTMVGYDQAVQKLDQGVANATNDILMAAGSGGDALGALVKTNASNQNAMNDLALQNAKAVDSYEQDLMRMIAGRAAYEDKAFQINVVDKFNRDAAAVSALKNAGIQNTFGAVKTLSGGASDALSIGAGDAQGLFGGMDTKSTPAGGDLIGAIGVPQRYPMSDADVYDLSPEERAKYDKYFIRG